MNYLPTIFALFCIAMLLTLVGGLYDEGLEKQRLYPAQEIEIELTDRPYVSNSYKLNTYETN